MISVEISVRACKIKVDKAFHYFLFSSEFLKPEESNEQKSIKMWLSSSNNPPHHDNMGEFPQLPIFFCGRGTWQNLCSLRKIWQISSVLFRFIWRVFYRAIALSRCIVEKMLHTLGVFSVEKKLKHTLFLSGVGSLSQLCRAIEHGVINLAIRSGGVKNIPNSQSHSRSNNSQSKRHKLVLLHVHSCIL